MEPNRDLGRRAGHGRGFLGLLIGIGTYSPSKRFRCAGVPSANPYTGSKRWHMTLGLLSDRWRALGPLAECFRWTLSQSFRQEAPIALPLR